MSSLKLVELILLILFVGRLAQADDDHLFSCERLDDGQRDPWIPNLESEHQLFHTNIEVVNLINQSINLLDETYDFLNKIGEYKFEHRYESGEVLIDYAKYFNAKSTVYKYSNVTNKCSKHATGDPEIQEFILQWLPQGNSV